MAASRPKPEPRYIETGSEPAFPVDDIKIEIGPGGQVTVYAYHFRHGVAHCQFVASTSAKGLVEMGRKAIRAGADAHNLSMWESDGKGH